MFSIPSSYVAYFTTGAYERKLPITDDPAVVKDTAVIDMKTTQPETYYKTNHSGARVNVDVDEFTTLGDGTAVLTVYQKSEKYPPAIWGTYVTETGRNYLNPLDVVAPGTVKMFENATEEELKDYQNTFEGTFGVNYNTEDGTLEVLGPEGTLVPAAEVKVQDITYTNLVSSDTKAKALVTQTGKLIGLSLSLSNGVTGTQYTLGDDGTSNQTIGNHII